MVLIFENFQVLRYLHKYQEKREGETEMERVVGREGRWRERERASYEMGPR